MNDMAYQKGGEQLPVHNVELEQAFLGSLLSNNALYRHVDDFLLPEHFYEGLHKEMFKVIADMVPAGKSVSPITIKNYVSDDTGISIGENPDKSDITLSMSAYCAQLVSAAVYMADTRDQTRDFGSQIVELFLRRELQEISAYIHDAAGNPSASHRSGKLIDEIEGKLIDLRRVSPEKRKPRKSRDIANITLQEISDAYQRNEVSGVALPLPEMSRVNAGPMETGNLYGLLGATKEGKSSLTAQVIRAALSQNHPVLVLSYDQTAQQWFKQMAAQSLGITANDQRKGKINEEQYDQLAEYFDRLAESRLEIVKCRQENVDQLIAIASRFCKDTAKAGQPALVVLDHVGKIPPVDSRADAGKQAGQINVRIKAFAGEYECVWFSIIQRNSEGARRAVARPTKKDIYGGEGAVADYDGIFYIYREEKWLQDRLRIAEDRDRQNIIDKIAQCQGKAEIGLIAHRFANESITRQVRFKPELTLYESIPDDAPEFGAFGE